MNDVWTWAITHKPKEGYYVTLTKTTLSSYIKAWLGGCLIRYGLTYRLGNAWIIRNDTPDKDVMELPITKEQAVELGWDAW